MPELVVSFDRDLLYYSTEYTAVKRNNSVYVEHLDLKYCSRIEMLVVDLYLNVICTSSATAFNQQYDMHMSVIE